MQRCRFPAQRRGPRTLILTADVADVLSSVVLTVENGVTERRPALTETSLEVPGLIVRTVDDVVELVVAVVHQAEDAGGDVLNVEASLRVRAVGTEESLSTVTSAVHFGVGNRCSELEAGNFTGVASSDIPVVVFTPTSRSREASEGRECRNERR